MLCGILFTLREGNAIRAGEPAAIEEAPLPGGKTVLVELEDGIGWITLNRPEKRNAISPTIAAEMLQVLNALKLDKRCQVVVLTGAGDSSAAAWT